MPNADPDLDLAAEAARGARTETRRRQLLDAAAKLMEQRGAHEVSMQAVADEARVSVGLIYRYFGNKQDLVQAVIVGVLEAFASEVGTAVHGVEDPVRRIAAAFSGYCAVVQEHREGAVLAYRESKTLNEAGRQAIMSLEIETAQPLKLAVQEAVDAGLLRPIDVRLFSYQLLMTAHSWALKYWYFGTVISREDFVSRHIAMALSGVLMPEMRSNYTDLLGQLA